MSNVDTVHYYTLMLKLLDQNGSSPRELLCWASVLGYVVWQRTEVYRLELLKTPQM